MLAVADLFCGAGGTSCGAELTGAAKVRFALNHWATAIKTHSANFPNAKHVNSRLDQTSPAECPKIDLLFASPECTHHSRARGGRPMCDQRRAGAWDVLKWLEHHRPSWLCVENVSEFREWGPLDQQGRPLQSKRGAFFNSWLTAIQAGGYRVEHRLLNAADFGAATSRERLFVVARKGNRGPVFPEPTHGQVVGGELPGMELQRWRPAAEIIDWRIPCPSVFSRKKPLADKTLARIEAGLRRFVGPLIVQWDQQSGTIPGRSVCSPLATMVTKANQGVAVPYVTPFFGERNGQQPRSHSLADGLPTVTSQGAGGVAVPFITGCGGRAGQTPPRGAGDPVGTLTTKADRCVAVPFVSAFHNGPDSDRRNYPLANPLSTLDTSNRYGLTVPYLLDVNHGGEHHGRSYSIEQPLGTVTNKRGRAIAVPFVIEYYGQGGARSVSEPLCTVTTKDRCGLIYAVIELAESIEPRSEGEWKLLATMKELGVADIGFRMLSNPELSAAQSFPDSYIFSGNKSDVTKQIGNAVCPAVAQAITQAILSV